MKNNLLKIEKKTLFEYSITSNKFNYIIRCHKYIYLLKNNLFKLTFLIYCFSFVAGRFISFIFLCICSLILAEPGVSSNN